jgi:glyoxylase-like metal-dependent hydrolase (beta-lactamase superfamily II)
MSHFDQRESYLLMTMPQTQTAFLPSDIVVLERGWLSANNIVLLGDETAIVDTGYVTHASQTVALVEATLAAYQPVLLLNTHLHSDHCGGNAALQHRYPQSQTWIPPGQADMVKNWDPVGLSYTPTGQECPPFRCDGVLQPESEVRLGSQVWQVHSAAGHDPHAIILFQPEHRILISADALWEHGFGVVFPELEGEQAFTHVADTLDLIEQLAPLTVIPGHGRVFTNAAAALTYARKRLDGFMRDPRKHALYGAKVLLKFKLLELQRVPMPHLLAWACGTSHMVNIHRLYFADQTPSAREWVTQTIRELVDNGAARVAGEDILNG